MCLTLAAQTKKRGARPQPDDTRAEWAYSNAEFDPNVARLPAGFCGHDIRRLSSELGKLESGGNKGEFETTLQWTERLRWAEAKPVLGKLTRNSTYAFVIGQNYSAFDSGFEILYNADYAKFDISAQAEPPVYFYEREKPAGELSLPILCARPTERNYVGANGFGAVREITEYTHEEYKLIIANADLFPFTDRPGWKLLGFKQIRRDVFIPPEMAREVKSQIRLAAVCTLLTPFVTSGFHVKEATLDDPVSNNISYKYLKVKLLAIWVYNQNTGVVYAKMQPAAPPLPPPLLPPPDLVP